MYHIKFQLLLEATWQNNLLPVSRCSQANSPSSWAPPRLSGVTKHSSSSSSRAPSWEDSSPGPLTLESAGPRPFFRACSCNVCLCNSALSKCISAQVTNDLQKVKFRFPDLKNNGCHVKHCKDSVIHEINLDWPNRCKSGLWSDDIVQLRIPKHFNRVIEVVPCAEWTKVNLQWRRFMRRI